MSPKPLMRPRSVVTGVLLSLLAAGCAGPDAADPAAGNETLSGEIIENETPGATPVHVPVTDTPRPVVNRNGRMVVEAMEYPWSAIGRVNTGGRGFCSGVLIGPRLVLASAQCLLDTTRGRLWPAGDIHFVAGYQRDRSVIHSAVRTYEVAPDFDPGAVNTFANIANNWALLNLETGIGYAAGWLAVQWRDVDTRARISKGDGLLLAAGYRRGWGNAVMVELGCAERACAGSPVEAALPAFVYLDEEFRVLGNPLLRARAMAGGIDSTDFAGILPGDTHWGDSRPPVGSAIAAALPRNSIARLLQHLGHLATSDPRADDRVLVTAIRDFERETGLPDSGALSVALLGHLLEAAVRGLPRANLGPQSRFKPTTEITSAAAGPVR